MRKSAWLLPSAATVLFASNAAAHIELVDPPPRYALPANKSCPCGDGDSNRTCNVTAAESTDPSRSTTVTTFEAGEVITIVAEEYIDHAGRMRVAFDPDGADLEDFNQNVLEDVADPPEVGLSSANPRVWEFEVTLPTTPCENCTLQVIQVMEGGTENEVLDPAPLSTYYTCADIRIVPAGSPDSGETPPDNAGGAGGAEDMGTSGGSGEPSEGGAANAGSMGTGTAGSGGGAAPLGTASESGLAGASMSAAGSGTDDGAVGDSPEGGGDGGCTLRAGGSGSVAWSLASLGLLALSRLRRRRRAAAR